MGRFAAVAMLGLAAVALTADQPLDYSGSK
jgi:hypothetical protein